MEIRELRDQGLFKSSVAERLGIDRGTVSKYWEGPVDNIPEPRYAAKGSKIDPFGDYITSRLEKYPELSAVRLFREIQAQGYDGSERTVRRYVARTRPQKHRCFKPIEVLPGEQAQVDWGHFGTIIIHGKRLKLYAFVFTLSWSRAMYVEFITSLNMATFSGCIHRAFERMGGVPTEVLFDNAKTVVSERVGAVVQFNETLLRLAIRYGFTPKACWVQDPESKGRVESNVKYVRNGFFYGFEYDGLNELNAGARRWIAEVAHRRVHGTTKEIPGEQLEVEHEYLRPFNASDGPLGIIETRQVSKDGLISVDQNHYSVPSKFQRQKIRIRRFENTVDILDGDKPVYRHELKPGLGQRIVIDEHYPEHAERKRRSHPLQEQFELLCPEAEVYLQGLSRSGKGSLRDQMEKIVSFAEGCNGGIVSAAMQRSIKFNAYGYGVFKRIVERLVKAPESLPDIDVKTGVDFVQNKKPGLQRDPSYYSGVGL